MYSIDISPFSLQIIGGGKKVFTSNLTCIHRMIWIVLSLDTVMSFELGNRQINLIYYSFMRVFQSTLIVVTIVILMGFQKDIFSFDKNVVLFSVL